MVMRLFKSSFIAICVALCAVPGTGAQSTIAPPSSDNYGLAENMVRSHEWDKGIQLLQPLLNSRSSDPKVFNLAGLAYTGKGDLKRANNYFRQALQRNAAFVPSLKNLGINEYNLHEISESGKHLEQALQRSPDDPVINLYLGEVAFAQQDFKRTAELLPHAPQFLSRDPELKSHLAISLIQTGQKSAALVVLDSLDPSSLSAKSQFDVGLSLAQSNQPERAISYFELVRQHYSDSYNAAYNLVVCYIADKRYPDAIALANQLVAHNRETEDLDNALAEAYEENHETERAIAALRRAIELKPQDEDNYLDFANLCINHRDFDNGLKVIAVGLSAVPHSSRLIFERGVLYAMQDRFDLAESDFQQSSRLAPETDFGTVGMGVTYLETGNASKAIDLLHQKLKETPNDASLLYLLGEALMRNGARNGEPQYAEAQASFEKTVQLNSALCLPHVALGEIYLDQGRFNDAIVQLERARAIDPKEKSAYSHLAVAYRRAGKLEEARQTLNLLKDLHQRERGWVTDKMKTADANPAPPSSVTPR
jgi:tetratricopeptide (TPR) repeat protein